MAFKIFGVLDFLCGVMIIFNDSTPAGVMRSFALLLLGKGGLFAVGGDIASYVDIICAFYMFALSLGAYNIALSVFTAIFLMQKAILTFLA
jgi:hypothetical protein